MELGLYILGPNDTPKQIERETKAAVIEGRK